MVFVVSISVANFHCEQFGDGFNRFTSTQFMIDEAFVGQKSMNNRWDQIWIDLFQITWSTDVGRNHTYD